MVEATDQDIVVEVAGRLRKAGIQFDMEKAIGGIAPDFIIEAPNGRQFVVQTKNWDFPGFTTEASQQAKLYQQALNADGAFIVIPSLKRNMPDKGVVTLDGLVPALMVEMENAKRRRNPPTPKSLEAFVFAAMPFAPHYEDVFFFAMSYAAEQVGAYCTRVDRREFQGNVIDEIQRLIRGSLAVFIDLSESKPNVLYEAGFAHALEKRCVHICSTPIDKLPFDVAGWQTTRYQPGQVHVLRQTLADRLKATLSIQ
jgi:hypothetical protein